MPRHETDHRRLRVRRLAAGALGLALAVTVAAGCGGGSDGRGGEGGGASLSAGADGPTGKVPTDVVTMPGNHVWINALDNTFRVADVKIKPGTTVTWTNKGHNDHDVLPVRGDTWGTKVNGFTPGASYSARFDRPGVYPYYCSIHGSKTKGMVGTVVVAN
jgi:plastocyanin